MTITNHKCIHEVNGTRIDTVFPCETGAPHQEQARECALLHKATLRERNEIEQTAKTKGAQVREADTRCPFYGSGICQKDCPHFQ